MCKARLCVCFSGPRKVVFLNSNTSVANATGLTKGEYLFKLTVTDGDENSASDTVAVTVTQSELNTQYFLKMIIAD